MSCRVGPPLTLRAWSWPSGATNITVSAPSQLRIPPPYDAVGCAHRIGGQAAGRLAVGPRQDDVAAPVEALQVGQRGAVRRPVRLGQRPDSCHHPGCHAHATHPLLQAVLPWVSCPRLLSGEAAVRRVPRAGHRRCTERQAPAGGGGDDLRRGDRRGGESWSGRLTSGEAAGMRSRLRTPKRANMTYRSAGAARHRRPGPHAATPADSTGRHAGR